MQSEAFAPHFEWVQIEGLRQTSIYSLGTNSLLGYVYAGTSSGEVYGADWSGNPLVRMRGSVKSIVVKEIKNTLVASDGAGVVRSTDEGNTWHTVNNGLSDSSIAVLILGQTGKLIAGSVQGQFYESSDSGETWMRTRSIRASITVCIEDTSNTLFIGTSNAGVFRFTETTNTIEQINVGLQEPTVNDLAILPNKDLLAGTAHSGIFRSTDHGTTWQPSSYRLRNVGVTAIAVNSHGIVFAGTARGPFVSTDLAHNWTKLDSGFTAQRIYTLKFNSGGFLFAGTEDGVYRSKYTTLRLH
ncbi:MAG: hypothetical protein HYR76_13090 [Ignavibacteria bacterium]|nr:hypothetical protein [Ignavibacteria bacterium]MBI3766387.1 hypothetical protein [Ignavibacteriales bacterium]